MEKQDVNGVLLIGDFNADPTKEYYTELKRMCYANELIISDVEKLPADSYTHVNSGSLSRSWLDHCVSSPIVHAAIADIHIDYSCNASDHMPMTVTLNTNAIPIMESPIESGKKFIKWNLKDEKKIGLFFELIQTNLSQPKYIISQCNRECSTFDHKILIEETWERFTHLIRQCGEFVFGTRHSKAPIIPGWNEFVEELYDASREAFLRWRTEGSPRDGPLAFHMRRARAAFKHALRQCRAEADSIRAENLARKLREGNVYSFWKEMRCLQPQANALPVKVDTATSRDRIVELWRTKYNTLLNSVDDRHHESKFNSMIMKLSNQSDEQFQAVTVSELKAIVKELKCGKAIGLDSIPNEIYKLAPTSILDWLVKFINEIIFHTYIPKGLREILLVPIIKNKIKDPSDSENYRPIGIGTTGYKIIEKVVLNRIESFIFTSDNQFGFKDKLSTELCIYGVKEVINYYHKRNTPIFLCFIDVKAAFDRVSHWRLLCKLTKRGIPLILVQFLQFCFSSQILYAGWGGARSEPFTMSNGLRQGSVLSPKLYCLYSEKLNRILNTAGIGCYIKGVAMNNFSYADDLVLLCPCASALNDLLALCSAFASKSYIVFNTMKTECMCICPKAMKLTTLPEIYLHQSKIEYVDQFKYLGHILDTSFTDDFDMSKELRNLYARGNMLTKQFRTLDDQVKIQLFKTYCYPLYCASLWSNFRAASLRRLRVAYNAIFRRLLGVRLWDPEEERLGSMSALFVQRGVRSFQELHRFMAYSSMQRVASSDNSYLQCLMTSEARIASRQWTYWERILEIP